MLMHSVGLLQFFSSLNEQRCVFVSTIHLLNSLQFTRIGKNSHSPLFQISRLFSQPALLEDLVEGLDSIHQCRSLMIITNVDINPHVLCVDTCLLYTSPSPRDQA
eukprot:TRINITY_DN686_c0_g1_i1.p4 TRINITY_DN686_c0_g1~~TRINITY_DN686_c0_g1_i1.p4  ORF type:complete len:105 (-),score=3.33 TRINITY_DN686_c0_g1_i1:45-359(-)